MWGNLPRRGKGLAYSPKPFLDWTLTFQVKIEWTCHSNSVIGKGWWWTLWPGEALRMWMRFRKFQSLCKARVMLSQQWHARGSQPRLERGELGSGLFPKADNSRGAGQEPEGIRKGRRNCVSQLQGFPATGTQTASCNYTLESPVTLAGQDLRVSKLEV